LHDFLSFLITSEKILLLIAKGISPKPGRVKVAGQNKGQPKTPPL
jgi:hypothetical protein